MSSSAATHVSLSPPRWRPCRSPTTRASGRPAYPRRLDARRGGRPAPAGHVRLQRRSLRELGLSPSRGTPATHRGPRTARANAGSGVRIDRQSRPLARSQRSGLHRSGRRRLQPRGRRCRPALLGRDRGSRLDSDVHRSMPPRGAPRCTKMPQRCIGRPSDAGSEQLGSVHQDQARYDHRGGDHAAHAERLTKQQRAHQRAEQHRRLA